MQENHPALVHALYARNRIMFMFCNGDVVVVCSYFQLNLVSMLVCVVSDRHVLEPYVSVNPSLYAVMGCFQRDMYF
jgi:hypothetical protein